MAKFYATWLAAIVLLAAYNWSMHLPAGRVILSASIVRHVTSHVIPHLSDRGPRLEDVQDIFYI